MPSANESDVAHTLDLLHVHESEVFADAGSTSVGKRSEIVEAQKAGHVAEDVQWHVAKKRGKIKAMPNGPLKDLVDADGRCIRWLPRPVVQSLALLCKPIDVILDDASIHKAKANQPIVDLLSKQGLTLHFLPPYSSELSRIERLWHNMKCT